MKKIKKSYILFGLILLLKQMSYSQDWEWAKRAGCENLLPYPLTQYDTSRSCAVDSFGNIYITGYLSNPNGITPPADFDNIIINTAWTTFFLAKYNAQGNVQWVTTTTNAVGNGVAVDSQDNIYVTGFFGGKTEFKKNSPIQSSGSRDVFVTKYNSNGNCIWAVKGGTSSNQDEGLGIAVDTNDMVYITGKVGVGSGNFGHTPITITTPGYDGDDLNAAFVSQIHPTGYFEWTRTTFVEGTTPYNTSYSIDTDTLGNVYIAGVYSGSCSFSQTIKLVSTLNDEDVDGFIAKYSSTGKALWAKKLGSPATPGSSQVAQALVVDKNNNIYVTGHYLSGVTIGNISFPVKPSQAADAYLAKFNSNGAVLWARNIGNPVDKSNWETYGWSLTLGGDSDAVYLAGTFVHKVKFDENNTLTIPGWNSEEIFLVKYNPDSTAAFSTVVQKESKTYPWSLATFTQETEVNLYMTGEFEGFFYFNPPFVSSKGGSDIFLAKAVLKNN